MKVGFQNIEFDHDFQDEVGAFEFSDLTDPFVDAVEAVADVATSVIDRIQKIPVLGTIFNAITAVPQMQLAVATAVLGVVKGERVDQAGLAMLRKQRDAVKSVAQVAPMVASFVPGVGTGVSAGLMAGLALAEGQGLDRAILEGVKGAVPGGPIAQAAFGVAQAAIEGRKIEDIALAALPVSEQARQAIKAGLAITIDLANGKRVDETLLKNADTALGIIAPEIAQGLTTGIATGIGRSLQTLKAVQDEAAKKITLEFESRAKQLLPKMELGPAIQTLIDTTNITPESLAKELHVSPAMGAAAINGALGVVRYPLSLFDPATGTRIPFEKPDYDKVLTPTQKLLVETKVNQMQDPLGVLDRNTLRDTLSFALAAQNVLAEKGPVLRKLGDWQSTQQTTTPIRALGSWSSSSGTPQVVVTASAAPVTSWLAPDAGPAPGGVEPTAPAPSPNKYAYVVPLAVASSAAVVAVLGLLVWKSGR